MTFESTHRFRSLARSAFAPEGSDALDRAAFLMLLVFLIAQPLLFRGDPARVAERGRSCAARQPVAQRLRLPDGRGRPAVPLGAAASAAATASPGSRVGLDAAGRRSTPPAPGGSPAENCLREPSNLPRNGPNPPSLRVPPDPAGEHFDRPVGDGFVHPGLAFLPVPFLRSRLPHPVPRAPPRLRLGRPGVRRACAAPPGRASLRHGGAGRRPCPQTPPPPRPDGSESPSASPSE